MPILVYAWKRILFGSGEGNVVGLNSQENMSLIHGRSLRGRSGRKGLPNQWRDKL